ncbi:hypothetical protein [endosymbiont of Lamellibrachia barhami]|nr:hypothetical protein [endosymbiont of Lamellibrachia barhami]
MAKSKRQGSNKDRQWVEAKRRCRFSRHEDFELNASALAPERSIPLV